MALVAIVHYRRRASRRMVADLPRDLADLEWDQPLAVMVSVREVIVRDQAREQGKVPADRKVRWGVPSSPPSSRLRSSDGFQSFHFARNRSAGRTAGQFDRYATKQMTDDERDRAGREEQLIVGGVGEAPARSAATFDRYSRDHGAGDASPFFVTTLDPDPIIRSGQWDRIEDEERDRRVNPEGGLPRINLRVELAPELLLNIATRNDCPPGLRDTIIAEQDRIATGVELPARERRIGKAWIDADAARAMRWLEQQTGWEAWRDEKSRPAKLSLARGKPTVWAGELELPNELVAEQRHAVLNGLNAFVQAAAIDAIERQRQLDRQAGDPEADTRRWSVPFMAAEHLPGPLNDRRNPHGHPQHGLRLVALEADGSLRFADHKIGIMSRMGWDRKLRCEAARLINLGLEDIGAAYRLSPDTYARMGLVDVVPMRKLGGKATVLENAGVTTDGALDNHAEGWRRELAKAQTAFDLALQALMARDQRYVDRSSRLTPARHEEAEVERTAAFAAAEQALVLRHEAAELEVWTNLAISKPERVRRLAPAYAEEAQKKAGRETYDAARWRARGREAEAQLIRLDGELAEERIAIREREKEASRLETEAEARYRAIDLFLSIEPSEEVLRPRPSPARTSNAHRAVDLIMAGPLMVTQDGERFVVRDEDDPAGKVRGIDLSPVAGRLARVHAAQQKEIAQVGAYIGKHGIGAVRDLAADDDDRSWLAQQARRWIVTPWMERHVDERRRIERAAAHRARLIAYDARHDDVPWSDALPDQLPELPGAGFDVDRAMLDRFVTFAPAPIVSPKEPSAVVAAPPPPRLAPIAETAPLGPSPSPVQPIPATPWTDDERGLRRAVEFEAGRAVRWANDEVARAVTQWARDDDRPSPLSARLLNRVIGGFRPEAVEVHANNADSRDVLDAEEIRLLTRDPVFYTWLAKARAREPAMMAMIAGMETKGLGPDRFGRVPLKDGVLNFAYRRSSGEAPSGLLSPRDWALRAIDRLEPISPSIVLAGGGEMIGLDDTRFMTAMQGNWLGMLDTDVQRHLEVWRRIQGAHEHAIRAKLWSGEASLQAKLEVQPFLRTYSTVSYVTGLNPDERSFALEQTTDQAFYLSCRSAELREGPLPAPLRHADAVVRAWLQAKEDGASMAVIAMLRKRVETRKSTLESEDAAALDALLAPAPVTALPIRPLPNRRKWARPRPILGGLSDRSSR